MMETPKRVLVVTPHPDDAEFGCGGTVARWVREGAEVYYILCTNGDKGSNDPTMTSQRLAQLREREQRDAAAVLGVKRVVMLRYPDGELEDTREFRLQLVVLIRRFKPDVVFCPDPFRRTIYLHRDHRICGQVTLDAVFPYARDRLHFPELLREGLQPHRVATVLLWGSEDPDTYIDITGLMETKVKALLCHRSQVSQRPDRDVDAFLRQWAHEAGRKIGAQYAEAFRRFEFRR